jgi:hypothetical protein
MGAPRPPRAGSPAVTLVSSGVIAAVVVAVVVGSCEPEVAPPLPPTVAALPAALPSEPAPAVPEPAPPAPLQHAAPAAPSLVVHNPCQQPLLLAVNVQDADGRRVNEGLFRIEPGTRFRPATKQGPIPLHHGTVHYYTETLETEPVELGRRTETVGDRELAMKSVDLDPAASATLELECPGMTSGRS